MSLLSLVSVHTTSTLYFFVACIILAPAGVDSELANDLQCSASKQVLMLQLIHEPPDLPPDLGLYHVTLRTEVQ